MHVLPNSVNLLFFHDSNNFFHVIYSINPVQFVGIIILNIFPVDFNFKTNCFLLGITLL